MDSGELPHSARIFGRSDRAPIGGVQSVDYTTKTAQTLKRINLFVESSTHGHIKDLLQEGGAR